MAHATSSDRSRHGTDPTVWARAVRAFVDRAEKMGIRRAELLDRVALAPRDLEELDSRVSLVVLYELLEAIEDLAGDPLALLHLSRGFEIESLEALAFVVLASPTLGAGLRAMLRYQRVFVEGERYELEIDGEWARISYVPWGPPRRAHAGVAEMFAMDVVVNAAVMTGAPFDRPRVLFAHARRANIEEVTALFGGVEPAFDQARSEVWLRADDLGRRLAPDGMASIRSYFERHLEERIRALPAASTAGRIRDMLVGARSLEPTVASLARRLRMSSRTLQRKLRDEGTSMRALLDETRRARAIPLLEAGHSIAEIAYLLGYADPSAFHRAFRRWTGRTPESFRASPRVAREPSRES